MSNQETFVQHMTGWLISRLVMLGCAMVCMPIGIVLFAYIMHKVG